MKKAVILILLLTFLQQVYSQYCRSDRSLDYSPYDCLYQYDFSDPNCTEFNFKECIWTECMEWVTANNDTYCARTEVFFDYSWDYCNWKCCDSSYIYPYELNSIDQCQNYLNDRQKQALIIICSVFGGIVLIILSVPCCQCISKYRGRDNFVSCLTSALCCCCLLLSRKNRRTGLDEISYLRASLSNEPEKAY